MGYTHYFTKNGTHREDSRLFEMFSAGARTIIEYAVKYDSIQIADGMGTKAGAWEATNDIVVFNGLGKDSHETFHFHLVGRGFNFCKTAYKPYDAVVTACLIHMKNVYGDLVDIGSDGSWGDWKDGAHLYRNATGLTAENPMASEEVSA